ncbi:MAG: hypothetical protein FJ404_05790 [Verrucomicrobia bacterium]|nr:hypothetical protein [Verrucomicrobiota bacterium]
MNLNFPSRSGRSPIAPALLATALALASAWHAFALSKGVYQRDFTSTAVDQIPDDFLVLNGTFGVKEENGNRFLELPGAPLDTFGVLFGMTEKEGLQVSGRGLGTSKGRRFPTFGFGLNGAGGYRLQVSPAKKAIELFKGDHACASSPFDWQSGKWTHFKLQIRKQAETPATWKVQGKVWTEGSEEPKAWSIAWEEKEEPIPGRASLWGSPFANTPIRFDDLRVGEAQADN